MYNNDEVVSKFNVIPLYQPLTFTKLAYKYFDIKPDVKIKNTINKNSKVHYPLNKIEISNNAIIYLYNHYVFLITNYFV